MSAEYGATCRISLEDFEGPLDLLLFLIRRDELDVTTIHVSAVADQYLEYIRRATELNLDVAGEYLVMAATLTRMKSRSMLPVEKALMEETEDPMEGLMRHLVLYRAFRDVAAELRDSESVWRDAFSPPGERDRYSPVLEPQGFSQTTLLDLLAAIGDITDRHTPPPGHRIRRPLLTLTECVETLDRVLNTGTSLKFSAIVGDELCRARVVSFFITVLELMKRGWLTARQPYPMGDIVVTRTEGWRNDA
jgi:segregation and condensation protein A